MSKKTLVELIISIINIKSSLNMQLSEYDAELQKKANNFKTYEIQHKNVVEQIDNKLKASLGSNTNQLFEQKNKHQMFFLYLVEAHKHEKNKIESQIQHINQYIERLELYIKYNDFMNKGDKERAKVISGQITDLLFSDIENIMNNNIRAERGKKLVNDRLENFLNQSTIDVKETYSNRLLTVDQKKDIENRKIAYENTKRYYSELFNNNNIDISFLTKDEVLNFNSEKVVDLIISKQKNNEAVNIQGTSANIKR